MAEKKKTYEERLAQAEALVTEMESGKLPLDKLVAKYEEGIKLLNSLDKELTDARRRLTMIKNGQEVPVEEKQ